MRALTDSEIKLMHRYLKISAKYDRFLLLQKSHLASIMMLDSIEQRYRQPEPTEFDLCYLQGINRRRSKNFRKLRGSSAMLRFASELKKKTLQDAGIQEAT